jgi:VCBS repeat-containing protein
MATLRVPASHRITSATNDFYTGAAGLSEDQLRGSFAVLSNDPSGARLWSLSTGVPHAGGNAHSAGTPRPITIIDGGITYSGLMSIVGGRVSVDFSQSSAAINALNAGDVLTGSFYYVDRLTNGKFSTAKVTFTIRGLNDLANITGTAAGTVTEDGALTTGGTLTANDPDAGENLFQNPGSLTGTYGTFTFNAATGVWGYTLNSAAPAVQALDGDDTASDTLMVTSFDGSDTQVITVTINGADDSASIGGTSTGSVTEDGTPQPQTTGGTLTVTDPDAGENTFQTPSSLAGQYGTFTFIAATGAWTYTLDNSDTDVQTLDTGETLIDTLTVNSLDGTDSQVISVTINGADEPVAIADFALITGSSNPWGNPQYDTSMDTAFGAGNWDKFNDTTNENIFDDGYEFIWIDGGDGQTAWFEPYVNLYRDEIEDYVASGGTLYINAGRWDTEVAGPTFDLGFGVTLNGGGNAYEASGTATIDAAALVNGPNGNAGSVWAASSFAHDYVTGAGLTAMILDDESDILLAGKVHGDGYVMLGGLTNSFAWSPSPQGAILEANILDFVAGQFDGFALVLA